MSDLRRDFLGGKGHGGEPIVSRDGEPAGVVGGSDDIPARPIVVTLCGSTRFKDAFLAAQRAETLAGKIVISVGLFGHQEAMDMGGPVKAMLDELHLRKIDLADEVLILNPPQPVCRSCGMFGRDDGTGRTGCCGARFDLRGYIGASTARELAYARSKGKAVRFLEPEFANPAAGAWPLVEPKGGRS